MDWKVLKALSPDTERQHLNKILAEIRSAVDTIKVTNQTTSDVNQIKAVVASMVEGNTETGISVKYNELKKVLDFVVSNFTLTLSGDVTGSVTITGLNSATINTTLDPDLGGVEDVELDNVTYWRRNQAWEAVNPMLVSLNSLTDDGFTVVYTDDAGDPQFAARIIEGTINEIDVDDGDGAAGNPVISLADLANTGVGSSPVKIYTRDSKGRIEGDEDADTDNLPEGVTNLYFTDERAQDAVGVAIAAGTSDGATLTYNDAGNAINIANTDKGSVAVTAHEAASDPHPQYLQAGDEAVDSVNGQTGIVVLDTGDITESGNLYFTDARARTAVITSSITNGDTTHSPSGDAVFDALSGKVNTADIDDGTYTPTVTGIVNVTSSTPFLCTWVRIGNSVLISGRVDIVTTAAATFTQARITIPVASNFTAGGDASGTGTWNASVSAIGSAFLSADSTNDQLIINFISFGAGVKHDIRFMITYPVL